MRLGRTPRGSGRAARPPGAAPAAAPDGPTLMQTEPTTVQSTRLVSPRESAQSHYVRNPSTNGRLYGAQHGPTHRDGMIHGWSDGAPCSRESRATTPTATANHTGVTTPEGAHLINSTPPLRRSQATAAAGATLSRSWNFHGTHSITASVGCRLRALPRALHPGRFLLLAALAAAAIALTAAAAIAAAAGGPYGASHGACDGGGRARPRSAPF